MKVRELKRILEGFDANADIRIGNVVDGKAMVADINSVNYDVDGKGLFLMGKPVLVGDEQAPVEDENVEDE